MPFKYDEQGNIVTTGDGDKKLPVFIRPDGREVGFDADRTLGKIISLNGEAKAHREAREAAELKLKAFEGIEDAEAARAALEAVKSLGAGKMKASAQVQEIEAPRPDSGPCRAKFIYLP